MAPVGTGLIAWLELNNCSEMLYKAKHLRAFVFEDGNWDTYCAKLKI